MQFFKWAFLFSHLKLAWEHLNAIQVYDWHYYLSLAYNYRMDKCLLIWIGYRELRKLEISTTVCNFIMQMD